MKLEDVKKIYKYREEPTGERLLKVSWKMTNWCNYQCNYCYMASKRSTEVTPSEEEVEKIAYKINEMLNEIKRPIHFQFIGGEPCLYDLTKICNIIDSKYVASIITVTNFSRSYDYYKSVIDDCIAKGRNVKFNASFHIEELERRNSIDEFIEKAIALKKYVTVKVMVDEGNMEIYRPYLDKLLFNKVPMSCGSIRDKNNLCNESPKVLEFLDRYNYDKSNNINSKPYICLEDMDGNVHNYYSNSQVMEAIEGGFRPDGWKCSAGLDCLAIESDGRLMRAACRMGRKYLLGNLLNYYELPTKPIVCSSDRNCSVCYFTDIERYEDD